jgi:hypothetical protein
VLAAEILQNESVSFCDSEYRTSTVKQNTSLPDKEVFCWTLEMFSQCGIFEFFPIFIITLRSVLENTMWYNGILGSTNLYIQENTNFPEKKIHSISF